MTLPIDPPQNKTLMNMSRVKKCRWIFQTISSTRFVLCHNIRADLIVWKIYLHYLAWDMFIDIFFCGGSIDKVIYKVSFVED